MSPEGEDRNGRRPRTIKIVLALLSVLVAVGLFQSCTTRDVTSVVIQSVMVAPSGANLFVGDSVRFTAEVRTDDGKVLSSATVSWSSADPSAVSIDSDGLAHALKAGSTDIKASFRDVSGSATVTVVPIPAIAVAPDSVSFSASVGGGAPSAQIVQVTNGGGGTLQGLLATVEYGGGQPTGWLDASLGASSAPTKLTLTPTISSLSAGTYRAAVRVSAQGASNSPVSIPVTLTLTEDRPIIHVSPSSVTLQAMGGTPPATTQVQVTNGGGGTLTGLSTSIWYAATSGWLSASLSGPTAPATLTIAADPAGLAPGTYRGEVRVASPGAVNSPEPVTVTFVVGIAADLAIVKTGPATALEGGQLAYDVKVSNAGPQGADYVVVTDTLPDGTSLVSAPGGTVTSRVLQWSVGSLAVGDSSTMSVVLRADAGSAGTVTNRARVSSGLPDPDPSDDSSTVNTVVSVPIVADLSIAKSGPASAIAGDQFTYTVVVSNAGPDGAQGVVVVDTFPPGVTFASTNAGTESGGVLTWNVGALAAATTQSMNVVVDVDATTRGQVTNRAWVSGTTVDSTATNNSSVVTTKVSQMADLSIRKTGPAGAVAGVPISYSIAVSHVGGTSDAAGVVVKDSLPAELTFSSATNGGTYNPTSRTVTWSVGTVGVGDSAVVGMTATLSSGASGSVSNRAWVGSTSTDPNAANDTSDVTTNVTQGADVSVTKTAPATAVAGAQITDTIRVRHVGGTSDASGVRVTDTLPAALSFVSVTGGGTYSATSRAVTWSIGTVAVGDSATVAVTGLVGAGVSGSVSNRAWVGTTSTDPNTANDTSTATTTVTQSADLSVTKSGPATDTAGTQISYTIGVSHMGGTSDASGVVVTDTLPAALTFVSATGGGTYNATSRAVTWSVGTVGVGTSTSVGLTATLAAGATGSVNNRAWVGSTSSDPSAANNSSTASTTVTQSADLSVTKTGPATATAGGSISYTIAVRNSTGPSNASGVTVTDTLPATLTFVSATGGGTYNATSRAVTWTVGTVGVGGNATMGLTATVAASATGSVSNRTWVGGTSADPNAANNSSTATTTIGQSADVLVVKSGPATATAGSNLTYSIAVANSAGPSNATGVTVTDTLPAALTFVSATGGGTYNATSRAVTWTVGTLAVNANTNLGLTATVGAGVSGALSNRAWVGSTTVDPNAADDSSTVTTTVGQSADLSITKTGPAADTAGTQINYTIAVSHIGGTSDASGVTVTDTLPAALTFVSATGGGAYNATSRAVTWNVGTVVVGGNATLGLTATVGAGVTGSVSNRAWVGSTSTDPNAANNSSTTTTTVSHIADLAVTKRAPTGAVAGAQISYSVAVKHVGGPSDASGVVVKDTLPAVLTFSSATGGGTYNATTRTVTWAVGTVAAGDSAIVGLTATLSAGASGGVSNRAWVSSTSTDPSTANDTSTVTTTVTQGADLQVKKTQTPDSTATAGGPVNYTIAVSHVGGMSNASNVVVTDTLPAGLTFFSATGGGTNNGGVVTWNLGTLAVGASTSLGLSATVGAGVSGSVNNRAWVGSTSTDPNPANDSSTVATTVGQTADLAVVKSGPSSATAGTQISYSIAVNHVGGASDASGVTVTDTLPAALTFVSATDGGTYNATSRAVTWPVGTLAVGGGTSLGLTVTVGAGTSGAVSNRAWVGSTSTDPNPANDSSTKTTTVTQVADLSVTKSGPPTATSGGSVTYALVVTNGSATSGASDVTVVDTLPTGLTYASSTGTPAPTVNGQVVTWAIGAMAPSATSNLGVTATAGSTLTGVVTNRAHVASTSTDPTPANNVSSDVSTTVGPAPAPVAFTNGNWNTPQTVTVTGVSDGIVDGDQTSTIAVSIDGTNSDDAFDLLANQTISVTTTDIDGPNPTLVRAFPDHGDRTTIFRVAAAGPS